MVGETIEERGRHLGIAEDGRSFNEVEIGRDDDRCSLIEAADQVEQELAGGLGEWPIAEFVEDQEVEAAEQIGGASLASEAAALKTVMIDAAYLKGRRTAISLR